MKKHLHRIIFNAVLGMRRVVQEMASCTGKGASKAISKSTSATAGKNVTAFALFGVLVALPGQAQIA